MQGLAYCRHASMLSSCGKHQLQGVWGAARPPSGEREGRSPLASIISVLFQALGSAGQGTLASISQCGGSREREGGARSQIVNQALDSRERERRRPLASTS